MEPSYPAERMGWVRRSPDNGRHLPERARVGQFREGSRRRRSVGKHDTPKLLMEPGGMHGIRQWPAFHRGRAGSAIRSGSDPDQFDVVFLDIGGLALALGRGGRGFEALDERAEL
jgi:hypothetical protein